MCAWITVDPDVTGHGPLVAARLRSGIGRRLGLSLRREGHVVADPEELGGCRTPAGDVERPVGQAAHGLRLAVTDPGSDWLRKWYGGAGRLIRRTTPSMDLMQSLVQYGSSIRAMGVPSWSRSGPYSHMAATAALLSAEPGHGC